MQLVARVALEAAVLVLALLVAFLLRMLLLLMLPVLAALELKDAALRWRRARRRMRG
jgi:hypothetical protein